jgi:hypothetical protein
MSIIVNFSPAGEKSTTVRMSAKGRIDAQYITDSGALVGLDKRQRPILSGAVALANRSSGIVLDIYKTTLLGDHQFRAAICCVAVEIVF